MSEVYSAKERLIIFSVLISCSLVIAFVYLFLRVDYKQTSIIIFILALLYFASFIFLNLAAGYDLVFANETGFEKFLKVISTYYSIFSWIDKIFGFVLFNVLIYYLESGYYQIYKKLADTFIRNYNDIKKMTLTQIILRLAIGVPLIILLLVLLIVYRKHFGLGKNPFDYLEVILDCYSIFEIYVCVGFFVLQLIKDYKMRKNNKLMIRYYNYTLIKVIEKTEKYYNKIKDAYNVLNQAIINFDKNDRGSYYNFLKDTFKDIKEKIDSLKVEGVYSDFITEMNNAPPTINENHVNTKDNFVQEKQNNMNIKETETIDIKERGGEEANIQKEVNTQTIENGQKEENAQAIENAPTTENAHTIENVQKVEIVQKEQKNDNEEKEEDLPTTIRKYKKSIRRIIKLKKLYKSIEKDKTDLSRGIPKKCAWVFYLLFVPFVIVICTDFILPIVLSHDYSPKVEEKEEYDKEGDHISLALSIICTVPLAAVLCSYTFIVIYTTTRRRYVTGDFLYDKQINDDLSLLKTVQIICGYSFALVYCNLYLWKAIDTTGEQYGDPGFYHQIIVPDYEIKTGISVYMIIKIVIIISTIIACLFFSKYFVFKNDFSEYNLSGDYSKYDNDVELNSILAKKNNIYSFLKS